MRKDLIEYDAPPSRSQTDHAEKIARLQRLAVNYAYIAIAAALVAVLCFGYYLGSVSGVHQ